MCFDGASPEVQGGGLVHVEEGATESWIDGGENPPTAKPVVPAGDKLGDGYATGANVLEHSKDACALSQ